MTSTLVMQGNIDTLYSRRPRTKFANTSGKFQQWQSANENANRRRRHRSAFAITINGNLTVTGKRVGCAGDSGSAGAASSTGGARWAVSLTGQKAAIGPTNLCARRPLVGSGPIPKSQLLPGLDGQRVRLARERGGCPHDRVEGQKLNCQNRPGAAGGSGHFRREQPGTKYAGMSNFGGGIISLWSAGNAAITYSTAYTACALMALVVPRRADCG